MSTADVFDAPDVASVGDVAREGQVDPVEHARALLLRHERTVNRLVRRLLGPDRDHEDIVQDVFLRLISRWRTIRDAERERAWVSTITVNHVRNHLRWRRVRRIVELSPAPPERIDVVEPVLLARDLMRRGYALLDRLRPDDRIALILRRAEERSVEETAQICKCSAATVKRRVRRAEQDLSRLLDDDDELRAQIVGGGVGGDK